MGTFCQVVEIAALLALAAFPFLMTADQMVQYKWVVVCIALIAFFAAVGKILADRIERSEDKAINVRALEDTYKRAKRESLGERCASLAMDIDGMIAEDANAPKSSMPVFDRNNKEAWQTERDKDSQRGLANQIEFQRRFGGRLLAISEELRAESAVTGEELGRLTRGAPANPLTWRDAADILRSKAELIKPTQRAPRARTR